MNGYCHLSSIKGNKVGMKFGLESLMMIEERMKKTQKVPKLGGVYDLITLAYYAYAGYYNNCLVKDTEIELAYEDFYDEFVDRKNDHAFIEEIKTMMDVFNASIQKITGTVTPPNNDPAADEKKNQKQSIGRKSKKRATDSD